MRVGVSAKARRTTDEWENGCGKRVAGRRLSFMRVRTSKRVTRARVPSNQQTVWRIAISVARSRKANRVRCSPTCSSVTVYHPLLPIPSQNKLQLSAIYNALYGTYGWHGLETTPHVRGVENKRKAKVTLCSWLHPAGNIVPRRTNGAHKGSVREYAPVSIG